MSASWQGRLAQRSLAKQLKASACTHRLPRRPRLEVLEDRYLLSVFTVSNTQDSGAGSLRTAIEMVDGDSSKGIDIIQFKIRSGAQSITLLSALPAITHPVALNATTQPGYAGKPLIELTGVLAGPSANGLIVSAGSSSVRGLVINRFGQDGILLDGEG